MDNVISQEGIKLAEFYCLPLIANETHFMTNVFNCRYINEEDAHLPRKSNQEAVDPSQDSKDTPQDIHDVIFLCYCNCAEAMQQ